MLNLSEINHIDFNGRFSRIVDTGKIVYFSGVLARNTEDIAAQTQDVLDQIDDLLAKVGLTKSNLVLRKHLARGYQACGADERGVGAMD